MLQTLFDRINADWRDMPEEEFLGYVRAKCQEILPEEKLKTLLAEKRPLRVKLGTDATGTNLHIGHIVPLLLLKQFQKAGHKIDFIIGDFTATIGDPSGRDSERKALTHADVKKNAKGFKSQIKPYLNLWNTKVHFNSKWLKKISLAEMLGYMQHITMSSATQREDFRNRLANGSSVSLAETVYGFLMGLDSIHLKTDIEIGGVDQLINFQQCRELMSSLRITPEVALCTPIIEGTDGSGKKMSKSVGNTINLSASYEDKFGKVMSIPDKLILPWYIAFTDVNETEIEGLKKLIEEKPLEMKKELGMLLIALETKSLEEGKKQRENFERKFAKKDLNENDFIAVAYAEGQTVFDALLPHFESKGKLRTLFEQNAVRNNDTDETLVLTALANEQKIRVGKRQFFKLTK